MPAVKHALIIFKHLQPFIILKHKNVILNSLKMALTVNKINFGKHLTNVGIMLSEAIVKANRPLGIDYQRKAKTVITKGSFDSNIRFQASKVLYLLITPRL